MDVKELYASSRAKATEAKAILDAPDGDIAKAETLIAEAETLRKRADAMKSAQGIIDFASEVVRPPLPDGADKAAQPESNKDAAVKAVHHLRFGEPNADVKAVLYDLYGADYEVKRMAQWAAFNRYLRQYDRPPSLEDARLLNQVILTPEYVKAAIQQGQDVAAIKADTMVEGADTLGGYLVPVDYQTRIIARIAAKAVVRSRATVVPTTRDRVQFPKATGGDSQYPSAVRVKWIPETPAAAAAKTNVTWGLETVVVGTALATAYLSRNLLEDAVFPVADYLTGQFTDAATVDEDNLFLTGDGMAGPHGILPDSGNALGLTEKASGNASALTWDGLVGLTYQIDAQYRQNAVWIAEKATYEAISKMKDGTGQYLWREVFGNNAAGQPRTLLGYPVLEQEAMPTIGAGTYPIIFGDLAGYYIADRVGMSIERFLDSSTAEENMVKYIMRRRLGGKCIEPWRFAVQKVAAS